MYIILLTGGCQAKSINAYGDGFGDRRSIIDGYLAPRCHQHLMCDRFTSLNVSLAIVRFETLSGGGAASRVMLTSRFNTNPGKIFARKSV